MLSSKLQRLTEFHSSLDTLFPIGANIVKCIQDTGLIQYPEHGQKGPFEYTFGAPFYKYYTADGQMKHNFDLAMEGRRAGDPDRWWNTYPIISELGISKETSNGTVDTTFVDISGNRGYDLLAFHAAHPDLPAKLILEDLPSTLAHMYPSEREKLTNAGIQLQENDFFTPQPIKGARAYFLLDVCHDWPDKEASQLLRNTADAMTAGYSRLLIEDHVLEEHDVPLWQAASDMLLMLNLTGIERTRQQWTDLLESAGLRIVKVWQSRRGRQSVIEAIKD
jgi:hypothetical protein